MKTPKQKIEHAAVGITQWIGTTDSIIVHTILFLASLGLIVVGVRPDAVLLIVTTIVSLEAIYLSIFIQMTVNRNTKSLEEVEEDIEEIQEDVKEIESDVDEISEDVEELSEDMDKIQERDEKDSVVESDMHKALGKIEGDLQALLRDIEQLKKTNERAEGERGSS
ncbi:MAG: DUF677 domain-containing protein [bacterium]|nr:DUF677 domain-containing protein [bacterium]MDZ4285368.1 DUF677 domain-containing protein [Candidatus Sungbacteria bacterium]